MYTLKRASETMPPCFTPFEALKDGGMLHTSIFCTLLIVNHTNDIFTITKRTFLDKSLSSAKITTFTTLPYITSININHTDVLRSL